MFKMRKYVNRKLPSCVDNEMRIILLILDEHAEDPDILLDAPRLPEFHTVT